MTRVLSLLFVICLGTSFSGLQAQPQEQGAKVERVGGTYIVTRIDRTPDDAFLVEFKSEQPDGRFDSLILACDHIHLGIKLGATLRLSAEVAADHGGVAEVSQLVVFLPSPQGATPVWLLSRNVKTTDLRATPFLKMHAPQSDYQVF